MKNNPLKIYIAAPYSAEAEDERLSNTKIAIDSAIELFQKGHYPYVPHLTHWVDGRVNEVGSKISWEGYMEWHRPWLEVCDGLLYLGSSKGADIELQMAKDLGKMIYYSITEVPLSLLKRAIDKR